MARRSALPALALAVALGGCAASVGDINANPAKYYQTKVDVKGEIVRAQMIGREMLFEIAAANGSRIIVHSVEPVEYAVGDWVRVRGLLVPETRVADSLLYDVVQADRITGARRPRLRYLF